MRGLIMTLSIKNLLVEIRLHVAKGHYPLVVLLDPASHKAVKK